jgi:hypothetical protein
MFLTALSFAALIGQLPQGAVAIDTEKPVAVNVSSVPVKYQGNDLTIVSLGEATFYREQMRLTQVTPPTVTPFVWGVRWNYMPPPEALQNQAPFKLEVGPFFKVVVKAAVAQYNTVDYKVSCAVFDKKGRLLGAESQIEHVEYVRLGYMPTIFRELIFDFGASKSFADAAYVAFSINDPHVPVQPDGQ